MSIALEHGQGIIARGERPIGYEWQGRVVRISTGLPPKPKKERPKRGQVRGWSMAAARRCIEFVNRIDWQAYTGADTARFLTLTYPKSIAPSLKLSKYHLKLFCEWLRYHHPDVCLIPMLERQGNGSPHWHCLWAGVRPGLRIIKEVRAAWASILDWYGCGLQVNFRRVSTPTDACRYVAGYAVKEAKAAEAERRASSKLDSGSYQQNEEAGVQWWGIHNRKGLQMAELRATAVELGPHVFRARRAVRAFIKSRMRAGETYLRGFFKRLRAENLQGFMLYTDHGDQWIRCFAELADGG